jgi:hypothetical protein
MANSGVLPSLAKTGAGSAQQQLALRLQCGDLFER